MSLQRRTRRGPTPRAVGRVVGRVRVSRVVGRVRPNEHAPTDVVRLDELPTPVFADDSRVRRRRLRRLSYGIVFLLLLALLAFWLSQISGGAPR
ncbi:hypothetical protein [Paractinoplanes rishiriensis]|uniref:Uncharacterized protein n=1 Tax=Paractinoplanes rishiriensis TaxID=1050105 RepID=A0A919K9H9_9ACTN|nr:hypothetical protein [Actinoplanes rishiriensis]GIF01306.1 hypothetical protein Ari01nite_87700 [Actinoplanes rishiriensis]